MAFTEECACFTVTGYSDHVQTEFSRSHLRYSHLRHHRGDTLLQDLCVSINLNPMITKSFKKFLKCTANSSFCWEQSLAFGRTNNLMQEIICTCREENKGRWGNEEKQDLRFRNLKRQKNMLGKDNLCFHVPWTEMETVDTGRILKRNIIWSIYFRLNGETVWNCV